MEKQSSAMPMPEGWNRLNNLVIDAVVNNENSVLVNTSDLNNALGLIHYAAKELEGKNLPITFLELLRKWK